MAHLIAKVAVEKAGYHFDKLYSYLVPEKSRDKAVVGARVLVPFGKGNKKSIGIIFGVEEATDIEKVKPIAAFPDKEAVADERTCQMAVWLKEHTFCTLFDGVKAQLPAGVSLKIIAEYRMARELSKEESDKLSPDERTVIFSLNNSKVPVSAVRFNEILGDAAESTLASLCKKGMIERTDEAVRTLGDASVKVVALTGEETVAEYFKTKRSPQQQRVYEFLSEVHTASVKETVYFTGVTLGVIKTLEKHGIVSLYDEEIYRRPEGKGSARKANGKLTDEQKKAVDGLVKLYEQDKPAAALLFGVTGSGKTRVYIELIRRAVEDNKNCIVMVPEIALTPQTASIFYAAFGDDVAIIHSGLSMGERADEWKRIRRGEVRIALGTRSAVFAPFDSVGLIIVDEEQESAYKSAANPRYHAREAAKYIAARDNALLVLGSATPSIETYYAAKNGRYHLFELPTRYGSGKLPDVTVCDVNFDSTGGTLGRTLTSQMEKNLENNEKTILLHNRRGYNTFVVCGDCKTVFTCPNCSVSMTYHSANGRLMCHYCGYTCTSNVKCRDCSSENMRFAGHGTQRVEDELKEKFPDIRVLRMDADTTSGKNGHDKILTEFEKGNYDVLLGTQMVAKGLDFPDVTLVGVISADQTLYCDDFRAYERAFSLLTQVTGRSGRGTKKGRAVIQTYTPENPIFDMSASQNYNSFFEEEIARRKMLTYPPFCDMCEVTFSGQLESRVKTCAKSFFDLLVRNCVDEFASMPIKVLNPTPATVSKMGNRYFYRLIIKCRNDKLFRSFMARLLKEYSLDSINKGVTATADINPAVLI